MAHGTPTSTVPDAFVQAYRDLLHKPRHIVLTAWETLIERYADGRAICNCRQAYYMDAESKGCENGCQWNQYHVRDEIARRALAEMGIPVTERTLPPYFPEGT